MFVCRLALQARRGFPAVVFLVRARRDCAPMLMSTSFRLLALAKRGEEGRDERS
jgi:hypothetical protein